MKHEIETQLSVTIANEPGQIARISKLLSESNIHINAISIAENTDGGHFRFIANAPGEASAVLAENGFHAKAESVLTIRLNDSQGRLAGITMALARAHINIDYVYASVDQTGSSTRLVLKVENLPLAIRILEEMEVAAELPLPHF
ncbi:MAG: amino acid-binding protein [Verrucomicrobiia bacterium]